MQSYYPTSGGCLPVVCFYWFGSNFPVPWSDPFSAYLAHLYRLRLGEIGLSDLPPQHKNNDEQRKNIGHRLCPDQTVHAQDRFEDKHRRDEDHTLPENRCQQCRRCGAHGLQRVLADGKGTMSHAVLIRMRVKCTPESRAVMSVKNTCTMGFAKI